MLSLLTVLISIWFFVCVLCLCLCCRRFRFPYDLYRRVCLHRRSLMLSFFNSFNIFNERALVFFLSSSPLINILVVLVRPLVSILVHPLVSVLVCRRLYLRYLRSRYLCLLVYTFVVTATWPCSVTVCPLIINRTADWAVRDLFGF